MVPDAATVRALSNADLDAAYNGYMSAGDFATADVLASEIVDRLATPTGAFFGLIGVNQFPLFQDWIGFDQTGAARDSVADSASNLSSKVGSFSVKFAWMAAALILVLGVVFIYVRFGKRS